MVVMGEDGRVIVVDAGNGRGVRVGLRNWPWGNTCAPVPFSPLRASQKDPIVADISSALLSPSCSIELFGCHSYRVLTH